MNVPDTGSNPVPTNDRVESRRILDKMSVGNRFRLMFGRPQLPEDHETFDRTLGAVTTALQKHMAEKRNDITEELLANAVTQALLCGDLQINIAYGQNMTEGQSVAYMPARQVATLKGQLEEATRKPTPDEVMNWMNHNRWRGSHSAAKTAIENARNIHNLPAPIKNTKHCEHRWVSEPTQAQPTRTACYYCGQDRPF